MLINRYIFDLYPYSIQIRQSDIFQNLAPL